jgi:hypothetical protein
MIESDPFLFGRLLVVANVGHWVQNHCEAIMDER